MLSDVVDRFVNSVPAPLAYFLIFLVPAAEASIFVGFVIPGETVVVLGGVMAYQHRISLVLATLFAILGATIGDSIGYWVGHRYGPRMKATRLGRVVGENRWHRADAFLRKRGGAAVFFGRYTALLRALVPAAAGAARLPYPVFLKWNVIGGIAWATSFTFLGYFAGNAYHRIEQMIGRGSFIVLGVVVATFVIRHVVVGRRESSADHVESP